VLKLPKTPELLFMGRSVDADRYH